MTGEAVSLSDRKRLESVNSLVLLNDEDMH